MGGIQPGSLLASQRLFGEDLPLHQSGFVSVMELVGAMSDIFYLQPPEGDDTHHWIVRNIQNRDPHSGMNMIVHE